MTIAVTNPSHAARPAAHGVARRLDRTYLIGLAILLAAVTRIGLMESEFWLPTGRAIIRAFLPAA